VQAERAGGFRVGLALGIAKHHRRPILFRHLMQFGIENRALFAPGCLHHGIDPDPDRGPFFVFASPGGVRAGLDGDALGNSVKPVAQQFWPSDRTGFADQHEKRSLKRIVRVMGVAEHAPAQRLHHRSMPPDQGRKSSLVLLICEPREKLAICLLLHGFRHSLAVSIRTP
jgi:hypothetical protein